MGVSETNFRARYDRLARRQGNRLVWDIHDLDAEAEKLPYANGPQIDDRQGDSFEDWQP
jgi:hypothetical protein